MQIAKIAPAARFKSSIFAICAFLSPTLARAQLPAMPLFDDKRMSVGLQVGQAKPTASNGFNRAAKPGSFLSLQYMHFPLDWLGLGADLAYIKPGKRSAQADAKALALVTRIHLVRDRPWTPYLLGGVGYHLFDYEFGAATAGVCDPLTNRCVSGKESAQGIAVTAGAGAEVFLFRGCSVSFEARYHEFRLKRGVFAGNAEFLSYLFGLRLWLGR